MHSLRTGLLLLLLEEGRQTDTGDLHDLETHTGDITLRLTLATETRDEHLVVLCWLARRVRKYLPSTKFKQPSSGTKADTFLPFLISWIRTHLRIAELGCLASTPIFSRTIPLACEAPPVGEVL